MPVVLVADNMATPAEKVSGDHGHLTAADMALVRAKTC